jgi:DNA polymerase III delta subunit
MVITITGSNSFAMRGRLKELVDRFVEKYGDLALQRIDAEEAEISSMSEAILSLPFLSVRKMVVVRNGNANKDFAEQIEQIISSIPETTDLILYETQLDRRTAYFKVLKSQTQFKQFEQLDKNNLARWLVDEAKKRAANISLSDAIFLVERVGENQEMLANELAKLATYNSEVSRASIELLTEPTPQSKVFDLLDAAFSGRKVRALELYADQRAQQVEPQAILAMIAWQLQLLSLVKFGKGKSSDQIARDTGMKSYPINKAAGLAGRITENKLRDMVDEALEIDIKSKTTAIDLDEALKTYITTL